MQWLPDVLRALDREVRTTASVAAGCAAVVALAALDAPYLRALPPPVLGVLAAGRAAPTPREPTEE